MIYHFMLYSKPYLILGLSCLCASCFPSFSSSLMSFFVVDKNLRTFKSAPFLTFKIILYFSFSCIIHLKFRKLNDKT